MGMLVLNTGFEKIVYQSSFSSCGSINSVFTLQQSLDSSLRHNLLLKTYEPCSISFLSSHCAVVAQWIMSSSRNVNVDSCLCQDFLSNQWNRNGIGVREISQN